MELIRGWLTGTPDGVNSNATRKEREAWVKRRDADLALIRAVDEIIDSRRRGK